MKAVKSALSVVVTAGSTATTRRSRGGTAGRARRKPSTSNIHCFHSAPSTSSSRTPSSSWRPSRVPPYSASSSASAAGERLARLSSVRPVVRTTDEFGRRPRSTRRLTCGSGLGVVEMTTCGLGASRRQNHSMSYTDWAVWRFQAAYSSSQPLSKAKPRRLSGVPALKP